MNTRRNYLLTLKKNDSQKLILAFFLMEMLVHVEQVDDEATVFRAVGWEELPGRSYMCSWLSILTPIRFISLLNRFLAQGEHLSIVLEISGNKRFRNSMRNEAKLMHDDTQASKSLVSNESFRGFFTYSLFLFFPEPPSLGCGFRFLSLAARMILLAFFKIFFFNVRRTTHLNTTDVPHRTFLFFSHVEDNLIKFKIVQ